MCAWQGQCLEVAVDDIGVSVPDGNGGVLGTMGRTAARGMTYAAASVKITLCRFPAVCLTEMTVSRICGAMTAIVCMRWWFGLIEMGSVWVIGLCVVSAVCVNEDVYMHVVDGRGLGWWV